jgi:hypothetical protein
VVDSSAGRQVAKVPIAQDRMRWYSVPSEGTFSSNGEDGTLSVMQEDDPDRYSVGANVTTQMSARTIALDLTTHRIYLVAAQFGRTRQLSADQPRRIPTVVDGSFRVLVLGD